MKVYLELGWSTESGQLFSAARPVPTQVRERETTGPIYSAGKLLRPGGLLLSIAFG